MENVQRHETDLEIGQSSRPATPFELDNEFLPPPPLPGVEAAPIDNHDQERRSPSPEIDHLDEDDYPSPRGSAMRDLDEENPLDDSDKDDPPPPNPGDEDPPPSDSDEEDPLLSDSDEEDPHLDDPDEEDEPHITLETMKTNLQFVQAVEEANLESQFNPAELHAFRNPGQHHLSPTDDPDLHLSMAFFISSLDHLGSQKAYTSSLRNIKTRYPESGMLSYDQAQRKASNLSGVVTWKHDMCVDSCAAFTGPFADLEECPRCGKSRYDEEELRKSGGTKKIPQKVFTTFPLGPQLQARWGSPEMAQKMFYRWDKTRDILQAYARGEEYVYDDIFCGSDYIDAVQNGDINDYDTVVMFSIDGAQLYRNKKSDCWIYIWIILDLAPDQRYKIRNILPGGVIPGPKNPKHLDSFLLPGLAHVSTLQSEQEGLHIWDSYNRVEAISFVVLLLILADAVAMAELSGSVGHHGKKGCRILCGLFGRNKPGGSHYYPVLLQPMDSNAEGSNHPDFDINELPPVDTTQYRADLNFVLSSSSEAEYRRRRLDTGIRRASIFDGLSRILELPTCFPGDIMHQPVINLTALMFELWCERKNCRKGDSSREVWDWAVLKGDVWKVHGEAVAAAAPYFPRSFDRTPRNPAEKLSSGYKAWELLLYFYGLGPGLFYGILPEAYYRHYCKLVVGIRIMYQRAISCEQLRLAHQLLLEWVLEFEHLYYQRKTERLHFVRQCVHSLVHLVPEAIRIGPPSLSAQWTMERVIGIFGSLIKQPSSPYANLAEQARKVVEVNAMVSIWPDLEHTKDDPRGSIDIGGGYLLLGPQDQKPYDLSTTERNALIAFYSGLPNAGSTRRRTVYQWARLLIPTGQVARSYWKEVIRTSKAARTDRNIKVRVIRRHLRLYFNLPVTLT